MPGDETLYIGQTAAGKMRPGDAEMVQELARHASTGGSPTGLMVIAMAALLIPGSERIMRDWHSGPLLLASSKVRPVPRC